MVENSLILYCDQVTAGVHSTAEMDPERRNENIYFVSFNDADEGVDNKRLFAIMPFSHELGYL